MHGGGARSCRAVVVMRWRVTIGAVLVATPPHALPSDVSPHMDVPMMKQLHCAVECMDFFLDRDSLLWDVAALNPPTAAHAR